MKTRKYKITVKTQNGDYESTISGKYEFEKAVEAVAKTNPSQPVLFGDSLAFIAGTFISAQLGDHVDEEEA